MRKSTCRGCQKRQGRNIDFRARQSGNTRLARKRPRAIVGVTKSVGTEPIAEGAVARGMEKDQRPLGRLLRMGLVCSICTATFGNGSRIAGIAATVARQTTVALGYGASAITALYAAVRGPPSHALCVPHTATG